MTDNSKAELDSIVGYVARRIRDVESSIKEQWDADPAWITPNKAAVASLYDITMNIKRGISRLYEQEDKLTHLSTVFSLLASYDAVAKTLGKPGELDTDELLGFASK